MRKLIVCALGLTLAGCGVQFHAEGLTDWNAPLISVEKDSAPGQVIGALTASGPSDGGQTMQVPDSGAVQAAGGGSTECAWWGTPYPYTGPGTGGQFWKNGCNKSVYINYHTFNEQPDWRGHIDRYCSKGARGRTFPCQTILYPNMFPAQPAEGAVARGTGVVLIECFHKYGETQYLSADYYVEERSDGTFHCVDPLE